MGILIASAGWQAQRESGRRSDRIMTGLEGRRAEGWCQRVVRRPRAACAVCGGDIGVFLKFGLEWRHYRGTDLTDLELFEPGHRPVLAWRSPGLPA